MYTYLFLISFCNVQLSKQVQIQLCFKFSNYLNENLNLGTQTTTYMYIHCTYLFIQKKVTQYSPSYVKSFFVYFSGWTQDELEQLRLCRNRAYYKVNTKRRQHLQASLSTYLHKEWQSQNPSPTNHRYLFYRNFRVLFFFKNHDIAYLILFFFIVPRNF